VSGVRAARGHLGDLRCSREGGTEVESDGLMNISATFRYIRGHQRRFVPNRAGATLSRRQFQSLTGRTYIALWCFAGFTEGLRWRIVNPGFPEHVCNLGIAHVRVSSY
jgi:hypothetical protein